MAISKQQPMRQAEIALVDAVNGMVNDARYGKYGFIADFGVYPDNSVVECPAGETISITIPFAYALDDEIANEPVVFYAFQTPLNYQGEMLNLSSYVSVGDFEDFEMVITNNDLENDAQFKINWVAIGKHTL